MFALAKDVKTGDWLQADGGFTCMREGTVHRVVNVQFGNKTGLALVCHDGHHFLDGQEDNQGYLVGLTKLQRSEGSSPSPANPFNR